MPLELIGMLDSPYVRRVAVAMHLMGLPFVHRPLSVFRDFDALRAINPAVKVPTLVLESGEVLADSTLILQYLEQRVPKARRLTPRDETERLRAWRLTGLALAACEKSVQIVYELQQRPPDKRHLPWLDRLARQLAGAYGEIERDLHRAATAGTDAPMRLDVAGISVAVAWSFTQRVLPGTIAPASHPHLAHWSARAEAHPAFRAAPFASDGPVGSRGPRRHPG
jgi:glutathione S-transferase